MTKHVLYVWIFRKHLIWHEGVVFKLKCNGISGSLLQFFEIYLSNQYQRVVLNANESDWMNFKADVLQGSVFGPLLFLVCINHLTDNISSDMRLFGDDSPLFTRVKRITQTHIKLVKGLQTISTAYQWKMVFNPDTLAEYI